MVADADLVRGQGRQPSARNFRPRRVMPRAGVDAEHHHRAGRVWASSASDRSMPAPEAIRAASRVRAD
ncbi:hypothetical protein GS11_2678 [Mycobacterium tuberculosis variant bovis BCG]|nr:hypothetical protein BCGT_2389 [Mycobacterium tuberculosis variant bovis BCG str. ATCC 35743]AKO25604.1 hypothetical protein GS11_2678 [Mycobacterium tuberculosis variant bovis BCG]